MYDKGQVGSVVETEQLLVERTKSDGNNGKAGEVVYTRMLGSAVYIGQGNWGGPKGPKTENFPPQEERRPDAVFELRLSDEAALLYR